MDLFTKLLAEQTNTLKPSDQQLSLATRGMTEKRAVMALANWAGDHLKFPNVQCCGTEMDLAVVTRARALIGHAIVAACA